MIIDIQKLFEAEEERKERKESEKKTKQNERIIKEKIIRDIRILFEQEEKDSYKPKRINSFWNSNYIEYESNGDKNRNLSLDECLNKTEIYLQNIIIDLQSSSTWKIQLKITINLIFFKRC